MYVYIHTFSELVSYTAVYRVCVHTYSLRVSQVYSCVPLHVYIHTFSELVSYTAVYMYVYIHTVSELVRYTAVYRVCVHTYSL